MCNRYHKDDAPPANYTETAHDWANMMSVAYKLLAQGGTNPWCTASCVGVPGLGFTKATNILFDALQFYIPSTATWQIWRST